MSDPVDATDAERTAANRRHWDDLAAVHPDTDFYDVERVVDGESSLRPVEERELGDVAGDRLLHLQCHIGLDSVSLAREGADVTAVDYSAAAIDRARSVADRAGEDVDFVESDVYDVPETVDGRGGFDVVFASYGVLCWIPDARAWMDVASEMLAAGGTLYLVDYHPFTDVFDWETVEPRYDYFGDDPLAFDAEGSYADPDAALDDTESYQWIHGLGDVVTGAVEAGLDVEFLHEFPHAYYRRLGPMEERESGRWFLEGDAQLPMLYSLAARARP